MNQRELFVTFLAIFICTALITFLGVTNIIDMEKQYLDLFVNSLLIEVTACIILLFKKAFVDKPESNQSGALQKEENNVSSYIVEDMSYTVDLKIDGSSTSYITKNISVLSGVFDSIDELNILTGDAKFDPSEMNVEVSSKDKSKNITVTYEPVRKSDNLIGGIVTFTPPLCSGDGVTFTRTHKYQPGAYFMTHELVAEQLKTKTWGLNEAKEFTGVKIDHQTKSVHIYITFPANYPITGGELWDTLVGYSSKRSQLEYKRVSELNTFKHGYNTKGQQFAELTVPNPATNVMYCIKWSPPTKGKFDEMMANNQFNAVQ